MRWISLIKPRPDAPFPAWMIFPVIFAALYLSHFTLLTLPYYWDEAGYYIPAALDFFHSGSLIPLTTPTNAHPPLPSIYLALWWKASGFLPEVTREAVLIVAAFGLTAVWRLAMRLVGVPAVAFWTVALTAIYPIWFVQSSLAHADIFAAACTLWGLVYALPSRDRKPWAAAVWFSLAALCKETAIVIPLTLAVVSLVESRRAPGIARIRLWRESAWLAACALPLAVWYAYHYFKKGFIFGNPEFLRYNAEANFSPLRFLAAFLHRSLHLTAHMNLFVPVLMAIAALMLEPRLDADEHGVENQPRPAISPAALRRIFLLLLINALLFSVLGGALLTRYLLPMYPLVLLLVVTTFYRRVPYWHVLAVVSATAFIVGLFINPPYGFAPEDNLAYARVIRFQQAGVHQLEERYPGATVLSVWPLTDELKPVSYTHLDVYKRQGVTLFKLMNAGLLEADDARVGQIVFRGKAVRRIDEESQDESRCGDDGQALPVRNPAIEGGDDQEQHQRVHGQQIAREQCAAQDAKQKRVDQQQEKDAAQGCG